KKTAKNTKQGQTHTESEDEHEKQEEAGQDVSQEFKKLKHKKSRHGQEDVWQKPFDPIFDNKVIAGGQQLNPRRPGLIEAFRKRVEKNVQSYPNKEKY